MFGLVLLFSNLCPSSFAIALIDEKERVSCFTLIAVLMVCDC